MNFRSGPLLGLSSDVRLEIEKSKAWPLNGPSYRYYAATGQLLAGGGGLDKGQFACYK